VGPWLGRPAGGSYAARGASPWTGVLMGRGAVPTVRGAADADCCCAMPMRASGECPGEVQGQEQCWQDSGNRHCCVAHRASSEHALCQWLVAQQQRRFSDNLAPLRCTREPPFLRKLSKRVAALLNLRKPRLTQEGRAHVGSRLPSAGPPCARRAEVARLGTGRVVGGYVFRALFAGSSSSILPRTVAPKPSVSGQPLGRAHEQSPAPSAARLRHREVTRAKEEEDRFLDSPTLPLDCVPPSWRGTGRCRHRQ
jgi:hypothetical protein